MTEKMKVEIDRKEVEVELAAPLYGVRQALMKKKVNRMKQAAEIQKKASTDPDSLKQEDIDKGLELLTEHEKNLNEEIIRCCVNGTITKLEDFDLMTAEGVLKLHKWIEEKVGISKEERVGFTKT